MEARTKIGRPMIPKARCLSCSGLTNRRWTAVGAATGLATLGVFRALGFAAGAAVAAGVAGAAASAVAAGVSRTAAVAILARRSMGGGIVPDGSPDGTKRRCTRADGPEHEHEDGQRAHGERGDLPRPAEQ